MPRKSRLAASTLTTRLFNFLTKNRAILSQLKISTETKAHIAVSMHRSSYFERFLDLLEEKMFVAKWGNQHDALKVFLNVTFLGGDLSQLERRTSHNVLVDILHELCAYELKTKQAISLVDIPGFIKEYFPSMVTTQCAKTHWWLALFVQRNDIPQTTLGEVCSYYLVLLLLLGFDRDPSMGSRFN